MNSKYMNGKIYQVNNSVNDTVYIGSTCSELGVRLQGHRQKARSGRQSPFYQAMRDIGPLNFKIELIETYPCNTKQELEAKELEIMKGFEKVYNDFWGHMSDRTKRLISEKNIGHKRTQGIKNPMFGKKREQSPVFRSGCVSYNKKNNAWVFYWMDNGKKRGKSFSCNSYGAAEAKKMAEDYRTQIFPPNNI